MNNIVIIIIINKNGFIRKSKITVLLYANLMTYNYKYNLLTIKDSRKKF